ncbi:hypothetical protein L202_02476 [Cryptococcus amylolentus CBS 6039]|uniref:Zn(2)-C6 fungal-type domain-containing protein n=1 Tax=Cryptococcus amylolentus CBS 6039 TaxID=1295533 RepID=A0A1E3I2Q7_9TREE|nr:hypothetical protein L202_02476 [Cryptococcus amylolentus CBS 6039]ODN82186.1 hypothetical protein L202_02476 [Cryptococcus amylolentus CBS 6039]
MSDNSGFVRLNPVSQAISDRLFLSSALPGIPSPSPITYTTTTNNTYNDGNASGVQLYDNSGVFPASLNPSLITYTTNNTPGDLNGLGVKFTAAAPSPASSGDKAKPKARSSAHVTNNNSIKVSGKEKKKHAQGYKRKSLSCEHCRQRRKPCDGTDFKACSRCTRDGIECIYVLAKGKRGSQKALEKLAAMGRAPSADGIIIATPSTSSLASSSCTSSMSPITPITPDRSTVELSSGPSPASVSAGHTFGFATPNTLMPFSPFTPIRPTILQRPSTVEDCQMPGMGTEVNEGLARLCDGIIRPSVAAAFGVAPFYTLPTPRTTPVKPSYEVSASISAGPAPSFSLNNVISAPSTQPSLGISQLQLPASESQGLSESDNAYIDEVSKCLESGDVFFSAPLDASCNIAPVYSLTQDTTPVEATVEMSPVIESASSTAPEFPFSEYLVMRQNPPCLSAPLPILENDVVPESQRVGWGMCGMDMGMDDAGSSGSIESPFNTVSFGSSIPLVDASVGDDMMGDWWNY